MPSFAIDGKRSGFRSTGIVDQVFEWLDGSDGKRRQSDVQARDEQTGMPLWNVEVIYRQTSYGRESNTTAPVRVGSPVKPVLAEFAPVEFLGLVVEVRMLKGGTGLGESWRAEAIDDKTGSGSASGSAGKAA